MTYKIKGPVEVDGLDPNTILTCDCQRRYTADMFVDISAFSSELKYICSTCYHHQVALGAFTYEEVAKAHHCSPSEQAEAAGLDSQIRVNPKDIGRVKIKSNKLRKLKDRKKPKP